MAKDKGFSVSFTRTRAQARKELKTMFSNRSQYQYRAARNPDKKGWTIFARMRK